MGLDNGIYVKSKKRNLTRYDLPEGIAYPFDEDYNGEVEILYWRKNWGLRNAVMNAFGWRAASADQYKFEIDTPDQVIELIKIIVGFMDRETWEEDGDSIWEYDVAINVLKYNIINLAIIAAYMQFNPDVYLEFYDSY